MRKKTVTLLLAGLLAASCLAACDGDNAGTQNDAGKVTQEQWTAAFSAPDISNVILKVEFSQVDAKEGKILSLRQSREVINGSKIKTYTNEKFWEEATERYEETEKTDYKTVINDVLYEYGYVSVYDDESQEWTEECKWVKNEDPDAFANYQYDFADTFSTTVEYAEKGITSFTYDSDEGVYYLVVSLGGSTGRVEYEFVNGILYSARNTVERQLTINGEELILKTVYTYTFTQEEIVLPEIEQLNALANVETEEDTPIEE